ncbi:SRPBCC family protein [Micromonospora yasonensis]|uniref:SRPBCC family protein n=1 Tax=Micromonospora yasonensis TaxID=1128667 RepID=UPI00222E1B28|nr:SRPBCC family protein [Micromonospora yasonensis]MCW3839003.1 SRPBCC family protein [Micromonospora yasonensis]
MDYAETITTTAGTGPTWAALANVTSYPRWTTSMSNVEPLDGPSLDVGNRFRIRQPGLPTTVWRVCELRPGASFAWDAHAPGVHTVAYHRVDGQSDGTTRISIGIRQTGALAWLVALLTAARTRRYLRMEAAGLRAAAEAGAAPSPSPAGEAGAVTAMDDGAASTDGR